MQFNYLTAPANNINVNVVQQQKFSHPYPEYLVDNSNRSLSINSTTPNSTIRSVHSMKNYRCPNPPVPINYTSSSSTSNSSTTTTVPLANNNSYSLKYHHQNRHENHHPYNQSNINNINSIRSNHNNNNNNDKSNSLSLCINRINLLKKSNKPNVSSQFNSMRCRKHRHRSHHFNIDTYQRYQLTKSYSNDTVNENPVKLIQQPQTTYKFI